MTLQEAAKARAIKISNAYEGTEADFIAGAHWYQENHSCCCSGCTKHNIALTTEKQNSEFDNE